jgi:hypothetical protein
MAPSITICVRNSGPMRAHVLRAIWRRLQQQVPLHQLRTALASGSPISGNWNVPTVDLLSAELQALGAETKVVLIGGYGPGAPTDVPSRRTIPGEQVIPYRLTEPRTDPAPPSPKPARVYVLLRARYRDDLAPIEIEGNGCLACLVWECLLASHGFRGLRIFEVTTPLDLACALMAPRMSSFNPELLEGEEIPSAAE